MPPDYTTKDSDIDSDDSDGHTTAVEAKLACKKDDMPQLNSLRVSTPAKIQVNNHSRGTLMPLQVQLLLLSLYLLTSYQLWLI